MRNFTKLRLWQLTDLTKVCYVDADTLVLQNIDDIFLAPAFSAALDNMSADERFTPERFQVPSFSLRTPLDEPARSYFNAGVMVLEPSASEFDALVAKLATWQPTRFAEQDLLNAYYVGRWNALPLSYNWGKPSFWLCPELCVFAALKVVHFSGRLKPWMRHYDGSWRVDQVALASPQERAAACGNGGPSDANLTRAVDCWWRAFQTVASAEHARSLCVARAKPALSRIPFVAETVAPKVLYVVHRFHPYPGGSENYVHWLATESADRGWHVTVLAGTNKGDQVCGRSGGRTRARACARRSSGAFFGEHAVQHAARCALHCIIATARSAASRCNGSHAFSPHLRARPAHARGRQRRRARSASRPTWAFWRRNASMPSSSTARGVRRRTNVSRCSRPAA